MSKGDHFYSGASTSIYKRFLEFMGIAGEYLSDGYTMSFRKVTCINVRPTQRLDSMNEKFRKSKRKSNHKESEALFNITVFRKI